MKIEERKATQPRDISEHKIKDSIFTMNITEDILRKDWDSLEEDEVWKDL